MYVCMSVCMDGCLCLYVCVCACVSTPVPKERHRGPVRIQHRLVNEAGDVSEDMEMGRHSHVPAKMFNLL